jgi:beta-phosphoglucomutase-like phosphatase (HAD superfamily)
MPSGPARLLFDIDGTLADTDSLHLEAFNQVLGPRGHVFDHGHFTRELQGFSTASISERFFGTNRHTDRRSSSERRKLRSAAWLSGKSGRCRA